MKYLRFSILLLCTTIGSGCSYIIENQARKAGEHLSASLMNFEDPQTVGEAMPTLLIIADSMASSKNAGAYSQLAAARMYGAYSSAFATTDKARQKILTSKGLEYARLGSCHSDKKWCHINQMTSDEFRHFVSTLDKDDVDVAYTYGSSLLSFINAHNDDWSVIASLSKATLLMQFVVATNESWDHAGAHLYLGAIDTTLPPAMGGKPEQGKAHFERAIALTNGRNLIVKVEYARRYARMMFDKELHHRLLTEVLQADPKADGLTLMNTWAQQQARKLLDDESAYFDE